jgi:hypothetical protein
MKIVMNVTKLFWFGTICSASTPHVNLKQRDGWKELQRTRFVA